MSLLYDPTLAQHGIEQVRTARRSPSQNPHAERFIGSLRRELLDHVIVLNESHARRLLNRYAEHYNRTRTHLALDEDAPEPRPQQPKKAGRVVAIPEVGGLHHRYERHAAWQIEHCEGTARGHLSLARPAWLHYGFRVESVLLEAAMPALTLKNLPEELHERLKERAALHHRSLNSEVIACLRVVLMAAHVDPAVLLATARRAREGVGGRLTERVLREAKTTGRP